MDTRQLALRCAEMHDGWRYMCIDARIHPTPFRYEVTAVRNIDMDQVRAEVQRKQREQTELARIRKAALAVLDDTIKKRKPPPRPKARGKAKAKAKAVAEPAPAPPSDCDDDSDTLTEGSAHDSDIDDGDRAPPPVVPLPPPVVPLPERNPRTGLVTDVDGTPLGTILFVEVGTPNLLMSVRSRIHGHTRGTTQTKKPSLLGALRWLQHARRTTKDEHNRSYLAHVLPP